MTQPTAMAGAYGNRLFSLGALIAAAWAPPLATSVPVRASVCCSRPRITATGDDTVRVLAANGRATGGYAVSLTDLGLGWVRIFLK